MAASVSSPCINCRTSRKILLVKWASSRDGQFLWHCKNGEVANKEVYLQTKLTNIFVGGTIYFCCRYCKVQSTISPSSSSLRIVCDPTFTGNGSLTLTVAAKVSKKIRKMSEDTSPPWDAIVTQTWHNTIQVIAVDALMLQNAPHPDPQCAQGTLHSFVSPFSIYMLH